MLYLVVDSYGTRRRTWTLKGAMSWLSFCSPNAAILKRGAWIMSRNQERVY